MSTPSPLSYPTTINAGHPDGVQDAPAATAIGTLTPYGSAAIATAWNDVAAGVIRLQVGQLGYPALLDEDFTLPARGGTPVGTPAVLPLAGGSFAVVWSEAGPVAGLTIHRQVLGYADGTVTASGDPIAVASAASGFAAIDLAGPSHAIAYAAADGLHLRTLPDAGGAGTGFLLPGTAGAANPSASDLGGGLLAVAYDLVGTAHLDVFDSATGLRVSSFAVAGVDPTVTTLSDGRLALAYEADGAVRGSVLDLDGDDLVAQTSFGLPAQGTHQGHADLLALGVGGFVVGWTATPADASASAVMGLRYGSDGVPDGSPFALGNPTAPAREDHVSLYSLGSGRFGAAFGTDASAGDADRGVVASAFSYPASIKGTDDGETLQGTDSADDIQALGGNDVVYGHGGADAIDGGAGDDELWGSGPGEGGYDKDVIHGGAGDDAIHASDGGSEMYGDAGDDALFGGAGQDEIHAGPGRDTVAAGGEDDIIYVELDGIADRIDGGGNGYYGDLLVLRAGSAALDLDGSRPTLTLSDGTTVANVERLDVTGSALADRLVGMDQADGSYSGDYLRGGLGDDYIDGRAGDDHLWGGGGNDTVLGGSGDDEISVRAGSGGLVDGGSGNDLLRIDALDDSGLTTGVAIRGDLSGATGRLDGGLTVTGIERVEVSGSDAADDLATGAGNDFIRGWGGDDRFSTGAGDDWIDGGAGADTIDAGAGNDTIVVTGGQGGDRIDGGAGYDKLQLDFWDSEVPLVVTVDGTTVVLGDGTSAVNVETVAINASNLDDVIRTGASDDVISARGGNDVVESGAGNDVVNGGEGDDTYRLGAGDDTAVAYLDTGRKDIDGGEGTDTVEVRLLHPESGVRMDMRAGTLGDGGSIANVEKAVVYGWMGKVDVVTLDGNDLIYGGGSDDRIVTGGGDDVVYGGRGDDYIDAGTGRNSVSAGEGDDTIVVGGYDDIDGEAGSDIAAFAGKRADYDVSVNAMGTVILTETASGRTATVRNVERFGFSDVTLTAQDVASAPPQANPDAPAEVSEDAALVTGSVTANDFSTSAARASLVGPGGLVQSLAGRYGTLTIASDNTFSYVPGAAAQGLGDGQHATDTFAYRLTDASGRTSDSTVTIAIAGSNDAPVAATATETARTAEDTVLKGKLLAASDAEGDAPSYALVAGSASHGTVAIDAATGAYAFTPDKDFNGVAGFAYVVGDGKASSAPKTVTVVVDPVNDAPVAATAAEAVRGSEDAVLRGTLLAGSDVDGDRPTFRLVDGSASHGTVTLDAATGAYAFTPDKDYNGPASFSYVVTDGTLSSAPKAVALTIDPVNDAPVAATAPEAFRGTEDAVLRGTLAKGSDVDGDALAFRLVAGSATHGAVTLDAATGAFAFTPDKDWNGTAGFSYVVGDGKAESAPKAVTLTLDAVNDAPVAAAAPESFRGAEDTVVRGGVLKAGDVDGDALTYALAGAPAQHGTVVLDASGGFSFTPDRDWNGTTSFQYVARDGSASSAPKTVTVTVDPVNDAPVAAAAVESVRGARDLPLKGQLLAGSDPDGDALSFRPVEGSATHGTVTIDAATGAYTFTPEAGYAGPATFSYAVTDGTLSSQPKSVAITLDAVNHAPTAAAAAETYRGTEDATLAGRLLAGADADGDRLSYALVQGPSTGSLALNADGTFAFTPAKDWNGSTTFSYAVSDGSLASAPKTVTLALAAANDAPTAAAAAESFRGKEDAGLSGKLLSGSDVDGDTLNFRIVPGSATHGAVSLDAATGAFSFAPDKDYAGPASFSYVVSDGTLSSAPKTVSLALDAVNDAPLAAAGAETFRLAEDTVLKGSLLKGTDVDGDILSYQLVAGSATHGTATIDAATGAFSFTPVGDYSGAAEFRYRVWDGTAASAEKTVSLVVDPVNDGPVARDDAGFSVDAGKALAIQGASLLANDTDADGDRLSISGVSNAVGGEATLNADGSVTYVASAGFSGAGGFSYTVGDGHGGASTAKVGVSVSAAAEALPVINGTNGGDVLNGKDRAEAINGKGGGDVILAGGGDDVVHGDGGADVVYGDRGNDRLFGDAGNDALFGGEGNDILDGGSGDDLLTGGTGADTFVFRKGGGTDTVLDFQAGPSGADILDVSDLGFRSLDEVKAAAHEVKFLGVTLATVIDAPDGTSINLALTKLADLHKGDFHFA